MVKFREDVKGRSTFRNASAAGTTSVSSIMVDDDQDENDYEPQNVNVDTNSSLMSQFANQVFGSFGSWDGAATVCGSAIDKAVHAEEERVPFPKSTPSSAHAAPDGAYEEANDMAVEWEGQEVQLVEQEKRQDEGMMPPPNRRFMNNNATMTMQPLRPPMQQVHQSTASSVAFSSIGSCHSWLPDQMGAVFGGSGREESVTSLNLDTMIDDEPPTRQYTFQGNGSVGYMSTCGGGSTLGGSVGGASLTKVFEHETMLPDSTTSGAGSVMHSPNMSHRSLNAVPSWERSLRSKSPLSLGSTDDDDLSLISKDNSFANHHLDHHHHGSVASLARAPSDDMTWTKE